MGYTRPYKRQFIGAIVAAALLAGMNVLLPKILQLKTLMKRSYLQEEFLSLQKKKQEKKHNHHHRLMGSN